MLRATKDHIATADTMLAAFTACIGFSVSIKTKFQIDRRLPVRAMLMINGRYASLNGEVESLDQGRNGLGRKEHKHEKCSNSKPTLIHNLMCRSKWLHNDAVMLSVPPNDRSSISNSQGQPLANTIFTARQKLYAKLSICGGQATNGTQRSNTEREPHDVPDGVCVQWHADLLPFAYYSSDLGSRCDNGCINE